MSILGNPGDSSRENSLTLHLDREAFANFVLSFLGKKEALTYKAQLAFVIRLNDIEQFCRLLQAKLDKESNVYVDHFLAEFSYNDNTARSISGMAALGRFLETRDVYPVSVTLTWNIILKLPNAGSIENQVVELSFLTNRKGVQFSKGLVVLSIRHTNQAWGIEVLNLLKDKIADVTIRDSNSFVVAKKWRDRITEYGFPLVMVWLLAFIPISLAVGPVGIRPAERDYYPDYSPYLPSPTPRWASMASTKSAARWSPIHRV